MFLPRIASTTCGDPSSDLFQNLGRDVGALERLGRPCGCDDRESPAPQPARDDARRGLVFVLDADERACRSSGSLNAGRQKRLAERARERRRDAHHLAGRAHLGPEDGVDAGELREREDDLLHRDVRGT